MIRLMKLIYFHGFGSSGASGTVEHLRNLLPNDEVIAPDIPVDPVEALWDEYGRNVCPTDARLRKNLYQSRTEYVHDERGAAHRRT